MSNITTSNPQSIFTPEGNSLALFIDADSVMKIKDVRGNIGLLSDYINLALSFSYGSFFDTTTQSVISGSIKAMELNTTDLTATNGFIIENNTLARPTRIKATKLGIYNLQFSAQFNRLTGGSSKEVNIWIAVNDNPISDTNTGITFQANSGKIVGAWNWFIKLNAGDYVEIMWTQNDAINIIYEIASGSVPTNTPSVIATISQVG